jgi:hypothetical protein
VQRRRAVPPMRLRADDLDVAELGLVRQSVHDALESVG